MSDKSKASRIEILQKQLDRLLDENRAFAPDDLFQPGRLEAQRWRQPEIERLRKEIANLSGETKLGLTEATQEKRAKVAEANRERTGTPEREEAPQIAQEGIATDHSSWRDLIKPTDPRYQSWLLVRSLLQAEHSGATTDVLSAFQKNGTIERIDILKVIQRKFDAFGKAIAANVTGTVSAENAARLLDELPKACLEDFSQWFRTVELETGIAAASLEREAKLIFATQSEFWKQQAFRFGLEGEIARTRTPKPQSSVSPIDAKPTLAMSRWQDLEISFLSDHQVQIRIGATTEVRNYSEFGFADRRSGNANQAWNALRLLAESDGIIRIGLDGSKVVGQRQGTHGALQSSKVEGRTWTKLERRIQEIRNVLRKHYDVTADPIPFVKGTGYQAVFKIGCRPSYRT